MPAKAFIKQGGNILKIPTQALQVLGKNAIYIPHAKRVYNDSGVIDDGEQAKSFCELLSNNDNYLNVNLAWNWHTGKKITKLYLVYPNNGSGDLTVTRPNQRVYINKFNNLVVAANNEPVVDYSDTEPSLIVTANDSIKLPTSGLNEVKSFIINNKAYTFPAGRNINGLRLPLNSFSLAYRHRDRVYFDGGGTLNFNNCKTANQVIKNGATLYWDVNTGFKTGKLYSMNRAGDASGDFTVTRNSTAVRINNTSLESVDVNSPVIDTISNQKRLVILPQATNLVQRFINFNDSYWVKSNLNITDNINDMAGGTNAYRLTALSNNSFIKLNNLVTIVNGTQYTNLICIKRVSGNGDIYIIDINDNDVLQTINSNWAVIFVRTVATSTNGQIGVKIANSGDVIDIYNANITEAPITRPLTVNSNLDNTNVTQQQDQISVSGLTGITKIIEYFFNNTSREITTISSPYILEVNKEYLKIEMN